MDAAAAHPRKGAHGHGTAFVRSHTCLWKLWITPAVRRYPQGTSGACRTSVRRCEGFDDPTVSKEEPNCALFVNRPRRGTRARHDRPVTSRTLVLGALLAVALVGGYRVAIRPRASPPSPYCRSGDPLVGVYHPSRLIVRSRCRVASGTVEVVKFEAYDGDVHVELRLDEGQSGLLSRGNDRLRGNLLLEIVPTDRARVPIPRVGSRISVVGPLVDDTSHGWREIHPAWAISSGTIVLASAEELRRLRLLMSGVEGAAEEDDG